MVAGEGSAETIATTRRPRIMHVITHLDQGGAEGVAMQMIERLRDTIDFSLFAVIDHGALSSVGQDMAERLARWDVPVHFGTGRPFKSGGVVLAANALNRALRQTGAEMVHLHTEIPELTYAVAGCLSRRTRRLPVLRTVHNSQLWIDWHAIGRWVTNRLAGVKAVAVSRAAAAADAEIRTRKVRAPVSVIYNGVAARSGSGPERAPSPFRVLFAGRLVHQKGADLLPQIFSRAHGMTTRRDVEVIIAGNGALGAQLAIGLSSGLQDWRITFSPAIGRLSERLGEFDCVLLPSRFEGFALLPLEVLLAGVPLVTTNAPGLDEAIPPGYPLSAPVDDVKALARRLVAVIDDPETYRAIVANLRGDLARRFSPEAMTAAYAGLYARLTGQDRSAHR
jgi:glycosyltransferase involved in cell wall biosynthesis